MVFASAGAPSALNGISKARQASLIAALDNKYAKRQCQIENNRMKLEMHRYKIQMEHHKKYLGFFLVVVAIGLFSVWSLVARWTSSTYYAGGSQEDKRSLQDLAESIRRVRLRRQESLQDPTARDGINEKGELNEDDKGWGLGIHVHPPHYHQVEDSIHESAKNDLYLKDPPDKLPMDTLEGDGGRIDAENRMMRLEEKIRISQEMNVKEELRAKQLEDKMAESINALKHYKENMPPLRSPDIEDESFS